MYRVRKTNLMHNLFLVYFVNFYMFRAYLGLSSGGTTICIQQLAIIIFFRWLSVVLVGLEQNNRQSSKQNNKYLPMIAQDTSEIFTVLRNILRIIYFMRVTKQIQFWAVYFIVLQNHSTCFGYPLNPPSGVHKLQLQPLVQVMLYITKVSCGKTLKGCGYLVIAG